LFLFQARVRSRSRAPQRGSEAAAEEARSSSSAPRSATPAVRVLIRSAPRHGSLFWLTARLALQAGEGAAQQGQQRLMGAPRLSFEENAPPIVRH
jgi:hypothetical protein